MARKAIFKHATQVDTNTYPDDGVSPIGSNEWNEAPDSQGMLGFSPTNATTSITSNNLPVTDSVTVATCSGSSDTINTISITDTNEYDILYLFSNNGKTITLTNTSSPSSNGQVVTVSGQNETLSATRPTILMRKGNYWYGYGGGAINSIDDINDVVITGTPSDNSLLAYDTATSKWINQTASQAGFATSATTDTTNASNITSGTLPLARLSGITNTEISASAAISTSKISGLAASATTDTTNASNITSGTLGSARLPAIGASELGVTAGTASASKALVVDSNKDLTGVNNLTLDGNLTVNGSTTTINSTTLTVDDKHIVLAATNSPSDAGAADGGITLKGTTDKHFAWDSTGSGQWYSDQSIRVQNGKEIRFGDADDSNYLGLKAPTTVSTNKVWTLPSADGTNGQVLKTDGSAALGWQTLAASATTDTTNASNISSGTLATARGGTGQDLSAATGVVKVSAGTVSAATIVNADISSTAAISTSKISGLATSATTDTTNASNITSGTLPLARLSGITNTEISASAAISTSKISGLATSATTDTTNASNISSGTLAVAQGGTGQTSYTNGQLLIGNTTGNTLTKATLTAGSGISITNGGGSITIAASGGSAAQYVAFTNTTTTTYRGTSQTEGTTVATVASGSGNRDIYIRKIDTNNEGVFTLIHKNGALVEVQIA